MLQKEFFQVQPFNPKTIPLTLIFTKTTSGSGTFSVPDEYNYIDIEIAGAAGQQANVTADSTSWYGNVGRGAIKTVRFILTNHSVDYNIGAQPPKIFNQSHFGGVGHQQGNNGELAAVGIAIEAGGGGGSSSVQCNNILITVGGGSGVGMGSSGYFNVTGGAGGGPNGGPTASGVPAQGGATYNGNDATDVGVTNFNSGNGYIKIWGGYDPYYN